LQRIPAVALKLDPGSKTTGLVLVRDIVTPSKESGELIRGAAVLNLFELVHRGRQISEALTARRAMRCRRRGKLRYRAPRFSNRTRFIGWLAPSLQHRVDTTKAWVHRIMRWAPISAFSSELVRFDTHLSKTLKSLGWAIIGERWQATKYANTFWRNGAGVAHTATQVVRRCK
jgi:hypothetical protein